MEDHSQIELYALNSQAAEHIREFLKGDADSFRLLINLFDQRVQRIVSKMVYSYHDAQDLCNDIWLKVAQNLHKFDQAYPFHAWLYRLTSNTCIDFLRKKREITIKDDQLYHQVNKQQKMMDTPESLFMKKEFYTQMNELMMHLDEVDRIIVTLRFMDDCSYEEIGSIVGMSKNTVGTRLFRARKQLKDQLAKTAQERRMDDATSG
ncbi:RNA polymerase sigma factor [Brevibacillus daliensis]|uniref:RNA polymerase sigma factor n=1 Tax=Brevibacillus daliensis TaxID=2892995 RepID=UPI001E64F0DA|nr:sigma-70 family RNA polymerase sigma factor [Brevibacillus daliensis]